MVGMLGLEEPVNLSVKLDWLDNKLDWLEGKLDWLEGRHKRIAQLSWKSITDGREKIQKMEITVTSSAFD